jgi:GH25 family lysozyme M1 (1,4-beta-N-acetylmuramidase)
MPKSRVSLLARAGLVGLGIFGLASVLATAPTQRASASEPVRHRMRAEVHYNVDATHSPRLLRQLAGQAATARRPPAAQAGGKRGVDVADYQERPGINWKKVAAAGIQFAAIKATEGDYYHNRYALRDLAAAQAAGLSVLAYAFAIPNGAGASANPATQAGYLVNYLKRGGVEPLPPLELDIEYNPYRGGECYGLSRTKMVSWIEAFVREIQRLTGRWPAIYTPAPWWQTCTGGSSEFAQTPLWVPDYTSARSPALVTGWTRWALWQYTSSGTVSGIKDAKATDLDRLNPATVALLDPGPQAGQAGNQATIAIAPADPINGVTMSFSAADLPAGLTISHGGLIEGVLNSPGRYRVTVRVRASNGLSGSVSFRWVVS